MPAGVTVGKLIPVVVLEPVVLKPVSAMLRPLTATLPVEPPLVKLKEVRLVLLAEPEAVWEKRPLESVRFPWVKVSLPWVSVKFLVAAMVVSPLILTAPVEVLKVPVAVEASKFPEVWV